MSALMEVSQLISQEPPPPPRGFMQDDSFSRKQVTASQGEQPLDLFGAFIKPQEVRLSSSVDELNSRFVMQTNRHEIFRFIAVNGLAGVLLQSEEHIRAAFGESSLKTLAIFEDDEGYRTLFCLVTFGGSLDDARTRLKSFDNGWWLQQANRFAAKLNFDFELV
jgi:hypothetical protein